eukprot:14132240-Alexandrium_andersonii.AAC.1
MAIEAMPMPSAAPFAMPANSASPELSAIVFCVVDECFRGAPHACEPHHMWTAEREGARQSRCPRMCGSQAPHPAKEN